MNAITTIFFDLGDTLGSAVIKNGELAGFTPFDHAIPVLKDLTMRALRLGVISNTGDETRQHMEEILEDAGLLRFFEAALLIFSSEVHLIKDSPAIFKLAAERAEERPGHCLFVGENAQERGFANQAKFEVCWDPRLVSKLLGEETIAEAN